MFDGYDDVQLIGEGGLGRVYRARRRSTGGEVAIKELRDIAEGSPSWHRARREVDALLRLKGHPYVVSVEELLNGPNGPCLVMELAPSGSLLERMQQQPFTPGELLLIGQQASDALAAAHDAGIIHRDVKPQNMLIGAFGQVKVCDFGIASLVRDTGSRTMTSAFTLAYASPEEVDGDIEVGPPTDVYSFGATMLHLITGRRPTFKDRVDGATANFGPVDPLLQPVVSVLRYCLAHDPADRPTMRQVQSAFDDAFVGLGAARPRTIAGVERSATPIDETVQRGAFSPPGSPVLPPPGFAPPTGDALTVVRGASPATPPPIVPPPPADATVAKPVTAAAAVVTTTTAQPDGARRRRRSLAVAAAAVLFIGGSAAAAALISSSGESPSVAGADTSVVADTRLGAPATEAVETTESPADTGATSSTSATTTAVSTTSIPGAAPPTATTLAPVATAAPVTTVKATPTTTRATTAPVTAPPATNPPATAAPTTAKPTTTTVVITAPPPPAMSVFISFQGGSIPACESMGYTGCAWIVGSFSGFSGTVTVRCVGPSGPFYTFSASSSGFGAGKCWVSNGGGPVYVTVNGQQSNVLFK